MTEPCIVAKQRVTLLLNMLSFEFLPDLQEEQIAIKYLCSLMNCFKVFKF